MYRKNDDICIDILSDGEGIVYNHDMGLSIILNSTSIKILNLLIENGYDNALNKFIQTNQQYIEQNNVSTDQLKQDFENIVADFVQYEIIKKEE